MSLNRLGSQAWKQVCFRFREAREGALPVVFAVALLPLLSLVGMSIDYAGANAGRTQLQSAADAAALEALIASEKQEAESIKQSDFKHSDASYKPIERAEALFYSLVGLQPNLKDPKILIEVERKGEVFTVRAAYSGEYLNRMPNPLSVSTTPLGGIAGSTLKVSGAGYIDIYTLLDTSSSMGIGASASDIAELTAKQGCAFSCHGTKPPGVQLRIDVMRDAVLEMIKSAEDQHKKSEIGEAPRVRIAINKFDHEPFSVEPLSSDYNKLASVVGEIKLAAGEHRGTDAKHAINWLEPTLSASGNGLSPESPRRFVFIVTDGLQDRDPLYRPINFPPPYGGGGREGAIDPAACDTLKAKGITVAILYTTHVGIPGFESYWQAPQPHIKPNLTACASPGFFYEASNGPQLQAQFKKMFKRALEATNVRLDK